MILYDIPSVAQITVNFSCFASQKKKDADMVKVTAAVTNTRADDPPKIAGRHTCLYIFTAFVAMDVLI